MASALAQRIPTCSYVQEPLRHFYEANPALPWMGPRPGTSSLRAIASWRVRLEGERRAAWAAWRAARDTDLLLVNSLRSAEAFESAYGVSAEPCYLGVDTQLFSPSEVTQREGFVLSIGEFERHKRPQLAVEAVAGVAPEHQRLVWIANRVNVGLLAQCQTIARETGVTLDVLEAATDTTVVDHLRRAGVLLHTARLEPFGLSVLEAMATATPVVAVNAGGPRELIRDGVDGFLAHASPSHLSEALRAALVQRNASTVGAAARQAVLERWTHADAVDRLEARLHVLASRERPASTGRRP